MTVQGGQKTNKFNSFPDFSVLWLTNPGLCTLCTYKAHIHHRKYALAINPPDFFRHVIGQDIDVWKREGYFSALLALLKVIYSKYFKH